ncbi:hypothetical protein HNQ91_004308 [Filimonas zeae]|uniref:Uncharacterized protein n=1 Tax=Filimonas zeae TaxID=1737353 RepID=A0A917MY51_9BACT|nr:hypothetical protein [Filimonas zeae]MDR6341235.1 hypothetical protein [Filimonas zeae]GGH76687.1 hypothetical protein GCM10011379_41900 [Filimonas zeae]
MAKELTYTGQIDKVLDQAGKQCEKIKETNPAAVKGISKEDYIKSVFNTALGEVAGKMPSNAEANANSKAATKLRGVEKMPYTNGVNQIQLK